MDKLVEILSEDRRARLIPSVADPLFFPRLSLFGHSQFGYWRIARSDWEGRQNYTVTQK